MIDYKDYLAACERLRRLASGEGVSDVYGHDSVHDMVDYDKVTVYDAEHDPTPATVEWLMVVLGDPWYDGPDVTTWQVGELHVRVVTRDGHVIFTHGHGITIKQNNCEKHNPTRGDVLSLLRVFSERKV